MQSQEEHDVNVYGHLLSNFEKVVTPDSRNRIDALLREFSSFKDTEKLLFCLLLPTEPGGVCSSSLTDDDFSGNGFEISSLGLGIFGGSAGSSSLHLSNQVEQSQAYTWIMSHLEEDASTCLRKDEVYDDYRIYCEKHNQKALNTADFGKVMKRAYPNVKPRRLGQRGQSRYCYGGMKKKREVQPPSLPDLTVELSTSANLRSSSSVSSIEDSRPSLLTDDSSWLSEEMRSVLGVVGPILSDVVYVLLEYAQNVFGASFSSLCQLAQHLVANRYVNSRSRHAFALIAHISSNPTNLSSVAESSGLSTVLLSPSSAAVGAVADVLHKGIYGHAYKPPHDDYLNSCDASGKGSKVFPNSARSSSRATRKNEALKKEDDRELCVDISSVRNARSPTVRSSSTGVVASLPQTPPAMTSLLGSSSGGFAYRSPLSVNDNMARRSPIVTAAPVAAVSTVASSAYQVSPASRYPFTPSQFSTSVVAQNLSGKPLMSATQVDSCNSISAYPNHQQPYAHSSTDQRRMSFSDGANSYLSPVTGGSSGAYCASTPTTPYGSRSVDASAAYTMGAFAPPPPPSSSSSLTSSVTPLPPAVCVRSPYNLVPSYKCITSQLPMEAPGAHDPITRVHLGGSSPSKQVNFFGISGGSSAVEFAGGYQQQHHSAGASTDPRPCSGSVGHTDNYYSRRYSNLSLMSPAPSCDPPATEFSIPMTNDSCVNSSWQIKQPSLTRVTDPYNAASSFKINDGGEDGFGFDNLPRVGASPGPPAIPPSSPTEFLSFYSAETAARRKQNKISSEDLDRTLTNLSPDVDGTNPLNAKRTKLTPHTQPLHFLGDQKDEHDIDIVAKREEMHDALLTPSGESDNTTASPPVTPSRERFASSISGNGLDCPTNSTSTVTSVSNNGNKAPSVDNAFVTAF